MASLLIEILTEELPPLALEKISEVFAIQVLEILKKNKFTSSNPTKNVFATPRRLAFVINGIKEYADSSSEKIKLLPKKIGFNDDGEPRPPLIKKLDKISKENNIEINILLNSLLQEKNKDQDFLFVEIQKEKKSIVNTLQKALISVMSDLPIPKIMFYQKKLKDGRVKDIYFIRPAHNFVAMLDEKLLDVSLLELRSQNSTFGHRFYSKSRIEIFHAKEYEKKLKFKGKVIASFSERKKEIISQINVICKNMTPILPDELINEICSISEWPKVYLSSFNQKFLTLPKECLILTMQKNQKYIPLKNENGELTNKYLIVSNIDPEDPTAILHGNNRVLQARLNDAEFFYNKDKKDAFNNKENKLSQIIYHNLLGNLSDRVKRITQLTIKIGSVINVDTADCKVAAKLSKNDLVTLMVGEFPELQGIMGKYYAKNSGEKSIVCHAIEDQYKPRYSGDSLPETNLGCCLSLAEKIESIVGLMNVGVFPSGEKDPMGLRRNALGIIRIIIEKSFPLSITNLIKIAQDQFTNCDHRTLEIKKFISDRVFFFFKEKGFSPDLITSCQEKNMDLIYELPDKLISLKKFLEYPDSLIICSLNKRIKNILKKSDSELYSKHNINLKLFENKVEEDLYYTLNKIKPTLFECIEKKLFLKSLLLLLDLKLPIENFFDSVMINSERKDLKINRLCLLNDIHKNMNLIANLSLLEK